jgi:UDP-N-acetylmuramyl pentapeptide phosphotransferase/UDP-N-acetylglucosamine-1-phosphate transferase
MLLHTISFIILLLSLLVYFKLADKFNIIDKPNERSSHSYITIRGGGVIFTLAAILWYFLYGFNETYIIGALVAIALISFLDDVMVLSNKIRISIHFLAVSVLFWQIQVFELPWYVVAITYIFTIGWINAFNFMDGINGITSFYALTTLISLLWISQTTDFLQIENGNHLIVLLIISLIIFSFFNARKRAKTFAGDIGSVGMAFLLAWFIIKLILETGRIEYILLVIVYGIDSVITIIYRLKRKENIFKAHRTHLYQYLSNELRLPHVLVSTLYAIIQLIINITTIILIDKGIMTIPIFISLLILLSAIYLLVRYIVTKRIKQIAQLYAKR